MKNVQKQKRANKNLPFFFKDEFNASTVFEREIGFPNEPRFVVRVVSDISTFRLMDQLFIT